jgi:hypothetical protein
MKRFIEFIIQKKKSILNVKNGHYVYKAVTFFYQNQPSRLSQTIVLLTCMQDVTDVNLMWEPGHFLFFWLSSVFPSNLHYSISTQASPTSKSFQIVLTFSAI